MFFLMAAIFLFMLKKKLKWPVIIAAGFVYYAVINGGMIFLAAGAAKQDIAAFSMSEVKKSVDITLEAAKEKGAAAEELEIMKNAAEWLFIKPFFALNIIGAFFLVFLVYFIVRLYALNRYGIQDDMPPFELWRAGEPLIWALIACLVPLVVPFKQVNAPISAVAYNAVVVLVSLYFTLGLSVISFLFIKYRVPVFLKTVFYIFVVMWSFLGIIMIAAGKFEWVLFGIIIVLTGILDTWFNFRKLEKGVFPWK